MEQNQSGYLRIGEGRARRESPERESRAPIKVVRSGGKTYMYCFVLHITGGDVGWQSDYSLVVSALLLSLVG